MLNMVDLQGRNNRGIVFIKAYCMFENAFVLSTFNVSMGFAILIISLVI